MTIDDFTVGDIVEVEDCGFYKVVGTKDNTLLTKSCLNCGYEDYRIVDDSTAVTINLDKVEHELEVVDWVHTPITECLFDKCNCL